MGDQVGEGAGGCCAILCTGVLQQFFNTRTWGANWTCLDKCCRCECCWDAGEFEPEDRAGGPVKQDGQPEQGTKASAGEDAAPPAYKPTDPMSNPSNVANTGGNEAVQPSTTAEPIPEATAQTQPQATVAAAGTVAGAQTGNL